MSRLLALCIMPALLVVGTGTSIAQSGAKTATLTVHIVNASGKPVWLAEVTVYGPRVLVGESLQSGDAVFSSLPAGEYRIRIVRYGYATIDIPKMDLADNASLSIIVRLASATVKQIAKVTATSKPSLRTQQVDQNSPSAELSNSLISALQSLPGITLNPNGQASVNGYSSTQTTVNINGVPVSVPGAAQNLQLFNADIFAAASVQPQSGGGGTIDFQTASPTLAWQGVARTVISSDHGEDVALQELGTVGDVGLSFTHAWNEMSNPLEGVSYLDASGLDYVHRAADTVNGNAMELRYEFSPENTIIASAVGLDSTLPITCNEWTGRIPCGYGPTNLQQSDLQSYQLRDIAQVGSSTLGITVYGNDSADDVNQTGYYVNGIHMPSSSFSESFQSGALATGQLRVGSFLVPLSFSSASVVTNSVGTAFGPLLPAFISRYLTQSLSTSLPLLSESRFDARVNLGVRSNTVVGSTLTHANGALEADYAASRHDSFSASFSPGNLGSPTPSFNGVSAPSLLQFICSENVGIGTGPSAEGSGGTQTQTTLTWTHNSPRWTTNVNAYRNVQVDGPIDATIDAVSLSPTYFDPLYLADAQSDARNECGRSTIGSLSDLYFQTSGIASSAVYQGVQLASAYYFGESASLRGSYSTTSAQAYGSGLPLFGMRSTVVSGAQLPNVPLHTASLDFQTLLGANVVGLFQTSYSSANNAYNLPAHLTFDGGFLATMPRGTLSLTMTNISNAYPGPFATSDDAVPLPMLQGEFPTIAQPLAPRTVNVGYRFHVGPPENSVSFSIPNQQFEAPPNGFWLTMYGEPPLPDRPPADPFVINREAPACGPKDVAPATAILQAEQSYVRSIEKTVVNGKYPDRYPPLQDGSLQFNYLKTRFSYVVFISQSPQATFDDFKTQVQPFESCAKWSFASEQQLEARHLFELGPITPNNIAPALPLYAPEVGLYHGPLSLRVQRAQLPAPENLAGGAYPSPPPNEPFAIMNWQGCPAEIRPAAQELLAAVQAYAHAYFDLHERPQNPQGLLIATHTDTRKPWISIRTEDLSALSLLSRQCMFVKFETPKYLYSLGLGGETTPEINYAPSIGLYEVP